MSEEEAMCEGRGIAEATESRPDGRAESNRRATADDA